MGKEFGKQINPKRMKLPETLNIHEIVREHVPAMENTVLQDTLEESSRVNLHEDTNKIEQAIPQNKINKVNSRKKRKKPKNLNTK